MSWHIILTGAAGCENLGSRSTGRANGKCMGITSLRFCISKLKYALFNCIPHSVFLRQHSHQRNNRPFPQINQKAGLARLVKHRFMYTTNFDYLQMLMKTHCTEELPSFCYDVFPVNNGRCLSRLCCASHRTMDGSFSEGWLRCVAGGCNSGGEAQTPRSVSLCQMPCSPCSHLLSSHPSL